MFGFVLANGNALTPRQLERYRGCYCGLCRALRERHGSLCRLTLNYDMTFLILLLTGMHEPEEAAGEGRCAVHPLRRRSWWRSRFTDYAADMNVALAYHNCMDDYNDDHRPLRLAEAKALKKRYDAVKELWPDDCRAMERCMARLSDIEAERSPRPDEAANCFGEMMGELFVYTSDSVWSPRLRSFGEALGRFVYMMDACVDYERDKRRGSYNPLLAMQGEMTEDERKTMLKMLIGECTGQFERLPIVQDADILRNVLYSGVWTQYALKREKKGGVEHGE